MPRRSWYRRRLSGSLLARGLGADKASSDEQSWCECGRSTVCRTMRGRLTIVALY
ncbi:hypothetical protein DPMN_011633 [Dreissena polymorpha]|uniref:Uncharacterized protein n=1 Tax=Dreissena polymorpha TaxID=45954 RepID=A0A9D4N206_DREPO|nr:hypothetical protein DPMN_011633 [Dreissena polymorpha]